MISVIIPAYNAEKTIERAVLSAIDHIPAPEVIVVVNGCTDRTEEIVRTLMEKYDTVKLIHSEKGASVARNTGLDAAVGEWIMFLDADDYYEQNTKQVLSGDYSTEEIDLWVFGHRAGKEARKVTDGSGRQMFHGKNVLDARVRMMENPTRFMQVWGKLFRSSIIKEQQLRFHTGLSLSEDSDFTMRYTRYCRGICFMPEVIYHYSLEVTSIMRQMDGEKVQKYIRAMEETRKNLSEEPEEIKKAFHIYILMHMNIAMVREVFAVGNGIDSKTERREQMKKTAALKTFADAIRNTRIGECFSLRMLPILFLKIRWYHQAAMVYETRAKQNAKRENG